MSASIPDWLVPAPQFELPAWLAPAPQAAPAWSPPVAVPLPDWLTGAPKEANPLVSLGKPPEVKILIVQQFEMVFPRVLERLCSGETIVDAILGLPFPVDRGAFMRWVKKDAQRYAMFKESKEVRSEVWAGEMVRIALGKPGEEEPIPMDLDRAKIALDTYKFLIRSDNKKEYGDTKQVEITGTISVRAALEAAQTRVYQAQVIQDDDPDPVPMYRQLTEPVDVEVDDED